MIFLIASLFAITPIALTSDLKKSSYEPKNSSLEHREPKGYGDK